MFCFGEVHSFCSLLLVRGRVSQRFSPTVKFRERKTSERCCFAASVRESKKFQSVSERFRGFPSISERFRASQSFSEVFRGFPRLGKVSQRFFSSSFFSDSATSKSGFPHAGLLVRCPHSPTHLPRMFSLALPDTSICRCSHEIVSQGRLGYIVPHRVFR